MMSKIISIIIPMFNAEKTVEKTIKSVLAQQYSEYEIICVNDGSTDRTKEIVEDLKQKSSKIKLFNQENKGVSVARNLGIKVARGEYILFLDADDLLKKDYLSFFTKYMGKYDVIKCLLNDGKDKKDVSFLNKECSFDFISKQMEMNNYFNVSIGQLIKREVLISNSLFFDDKLTFGEDLLFNYYLYKCVKKIFVLDNTGYLYCPNDVSYTNNYSLEKVLRKCKDLLYLYSIMGYERYVDMCWYKIYINIRNYIQLDKNSSYKLFSDLYLRIYDKSLFNKKYNYKSKMDSLFMNLLAHNKWLFYIIFKFLKK